MLFDDAAGVVAEAGAATIGVGAGAGAATGVGAYATALGSTIRDPIGA